MVGVDDRSGGSGTCYVASTKSQVVGLGRTLNELSQKKSKYHRLFLPLSIVPNLHHHPIFLSFNDHMSHSLSAEISRPGDRILNNSHSSSSWPPKSYVPVLTAMSPVSNANSPFLPPPQAIFDVTAPTSPCRETRVQVIIRAFP